MDALPQNWKPYRPLIPAAALLAAGGWLLFGSGGKLPFTSEVIGSECRRLEVLRKNILELREQNRQLEAEIRPLAAIRAGAAAEEKEAAAEKLRESVERIAAASGATVSSLREIQHLPAAEVWNICILSFSAECSISGLQEFLAGVDNHEPRLYWRNLTLRPDNTNAPAKVMLDGQLALLHIPEEEE